MSAPATDDTLLKSSERMITEALIVFEEIHFAQGTFVSQCRQFSRRKAERLQGSADEGAQEPQAWLEVLAIRSGDRPLGNHLVRQRQIGEPDPLSDFLSCSVQVILPRRNVVRKIEGGDPTYQALSPLRC